MQNGLGSWGLHGEAGDGRRATCFWGQSVVVMTGWVDIGFNKFNTEY